MIAVVTCISKILIGTSVVRILGLRQLVNMNFSAPSTRLLSAADHIPTAIPTNLVAGLAGPTIKLSQPCPYLHLLRTLPGLGCVDQTGHVAIRVLVLMHQLMGMTNFIKVIRTR